MLCRVLAIAAAAGFALAAGPAAQPPKDTKQPDKPAGQPTPPPGMSEADMKACIDAATPGPMHDHLARYVGVWNCKTSMWMARDTEPMSGDGTVTITPLLDGRFIKWEISGDCPGMGPFNGVAINGYDNVSQKFQSTCINNHGTGIASGTGDLSADGKTLTWSYTVNCPVNKKPMTMRQVERLTGNDSLIITMYGPDLKTGDEFKMMEITSTRKPGAPITPTR
jgi:Protein of unknown function (DUF1579)